jgi:hypothetical protein
VQTILPFNFHQYLINKLNSERIHSFRVRQSRFEISSGANCVHTGEGRKDLGSASRRLLCPGESGWSAARGHSGAAACLPTIWFASDFCC